MPNIQEVRAKYPQYDDMSDGQLADALHAKFYSDMPRADFNSKIGYEPSSVMGDVAKSGGIGVANGLVGMAGMSGDILNAGLKGIDSLTGTGLAQKYEGSGTDELQRNIEDVTGKFYKPQTTAGKYAESVGSFLPWVAGGPEGLATKVATRAIAPGIASEAAGQLTSGTDAEPYARIAGALAGGVGAGKIANSLAERSALKAATPTLDTLKTDTSKGYDALTAGNVATPLAPTVLENLSTDIRETLNRKGIRPTNAPSIHSALDELKTPATAGAPDIADLVASRQSIKGLLGAPDTNKAGAFVALNKIEKAIEASAPGKMDELRSLDKNWGAVRANEALDKKLVAAELRAAGEHSGMNIGNKIRQKATELLTGAQAKYFSPETKAALESVVRGKPTSNTLRYVSNLLGGGGGIGQAAIGAMGGAFAGGGTEGASIGAAVPVLAGALTRNRYNAMVQKQAAAAGRTIRASSPMGQTALAAAPPLTLTHLTPQQKGLLALIAANSGVPSANQSQPLPVR